MKTTTVNQEQPTKVIDVTIVLSLGKETTGRIFKTIFTEKEDILKSAKKKYTSILHMGGKVALAN